MALEGVVTNVTAFGAFVDIGVHRDGLVHVSQLRHRVTIGSRVRVQVLHVDLHRQRISLGIAAEEHNTYTTEGPEDMQTVKRRKLEHRPQGSLEGVKLVRTAC